MKQSLKLHNEEFYSASNKTPQYLEFHRTFKKEFTKALKDIGCEEIKIGKPNHFDVSGFFRDPNRQIWYFRLEDLRWSKEQLLIRKAAHYEDYTGGRNEYVPFNKNMIKLIKLMIR